MILQRISHLPRSTTSSTFARNMFANFLPHFAEGTVCKGYGRGSKELGIPTANFDHHAVEKLPKELDCGIYFGFANVDNGPVHKAVLSIGWNPYYRNDRKSVETYIMHDFAEDFYGAHMKLIVLGYIRAEKDFPTLDDLVSEIRNDILIADQKLELSEYSAHRSHKFFQSGNGLPESSSQ